jgi:hypothetical protein
MQAAGIMAKKTGPKPSEEGPRDALFAMKCRKAYKVWLSEVARAERSTPSDLVDRALVEYAKAKGHKLPPLR